MLHFIQDLFIKENKDETHTLANTCKLTKRKTDQKIKSITSKENKNILPLLVSASCHQIIISLLSFKICTKQHARSSTSKTASISLIPSLSLSGSRDLPPFTLPLCTRVLSPISELQTLQTNGYLFVYSVFTRRRRHHIYTVCTKRRTVIDDKKKMCRIFRLNELKK